MEIAGLLSLLCVLGSAVLIASLFGTTILVEKVLLFFIGLSGQIVLVSYLLSGLGRLDSAGWWLAGNGALLVALFGAALWVRRRRKRRNDSPNSKSTPIRQDRVDQAGRESRASLLRSFRVVAMAVTVAICGVANLLVVILCAPGTWDCMAYHLARAAYYLQQGSFAAYDANYWAQVVHPVNSTALNLFTLVATGSENLTQFWQFASYWASIAAVSGIASALGFTRRAALCGALLFGLLTTCLMEASTAQNDLFLTAGMGSAVYFFLAWRRAPAIWRLTLSGVSLGLAIGTKASALLAMPSLIVIALCAALTKSTAPSTESRSPSRTALSVTAAIAGVLLFVLPAGYLRNLNVVGHPVASAAVRAEHSFEGRALSDRVQAGGRNALRYAIEFLSLDGIRPCPAAQAVQDGLRSIPHAALSFVGCDLERTAPSGDTREPYSLTRPPISHEDESYFGILGFGLALPIGLLVLVRLLKPPAGWMLAAAAFVFFLAQSIAGPFDPWRGRYFMVMGLLVAPLTGYYLTHGRGALFNGLATLIVAAGCMGALSAVAFHEGRALFGAEDSFFGQSRIEQLAANRPKYGQALERFEELVPENAVVAVCLEPNSHEYPLFGPHRTRRLIPLNSFHGSVKPIPTDADYLLYDHRRVRVSPFFDRSDLRLGKDWYLRKLPTSSRDR